MAVRVEYFGIRHHGPGSARRLVEALDALKPTDVLVEGPADLSDQLPLLVDEGMVPPVALLAYSKDAPERASFWPFAVFSPEYQAVAWAVEHSVPVRFIDLPVAWRFPPEEDASEGANADEVVRSPSQGGGLSFSQRIARDPIGVLADAAGYEDGESWWRDVIEENPDTGPIFAAVADAMAALRESEADVPQLEAAREAHMRLEIAKSAKSAQGPVAVVCGAWHVPALKTKHAAAADKALLKNPPKARIVATWAPWTSPRLAFASGYGAGVAAPGWCKHLWQARGKDQGTVWIGKIARALRAEGQMVSTASLIETERLAVGLAAVRGRPQPGFEEFREAVIATLLFGDPLLWRVVERRILLGNAVGAIPDTVTAAPLLEDLQRQQKQARLKPEALEKVLSLDLRSQAGLFRSTLLHRLNALGVRWGQLTDAGRSRGTFRERWVLEWDPEYAVQLVENLIYGTTIQRAASGRLMALMKGADALGQLADLTFSAMTSQLPEAAQRGIDRLADRAGETSDCLELLGALPGLADVMRYGKARRMNAGQIADLFVRIGIQGALSTRYASRNLDEEAARAFRTALQQADSAIRLAEADDLTDTWMSALEAMVTDGKAARLVMGGAARLLYEADGMTPDEAVALLGRMLSPGTAPADAAAFFEGFFEGAGQRLLYDAGLRESVDRWMTSLDGDVFVEYLPVFRRVFSALDKTEKTRLLDALLRGTHRSSTRVLVPEAEAIWPDHFAALTKILAGGASHD